MGGAILFCVDGTVVGSSFVNCSVTDYGGAIFCNGQNSNYNIHNSSFVNCSAYQGGAILFMGDSNTDRVHISNSSFIDNYDNGGRALYADCNVNIVNSIFLTKKEIAGGTHVRVGDSSIVDYNWWGNNATNYNSTPNTINMVSKTPNNWYFLDMVADDTLATVSLNNVYTVSTKNVTVHDDCTLPAVNFTLTGVHVSLSEKLVLVENGKATFTYGGNPISLTASYSSASITCADPNMMVTANTIVECENATIIVRLPDNARGNVTITVGDRNQTFVLQDNFDGRLVWNVSGLVPGNYIAFAHYDGGDYSCGNYLGDMDSDKFIVKHKTNITLNCIGGSVGSVARIDATLPAGATGNVTIIVNGRIYSRASGDILNIPGLAAGNWTVSVLSW